MKRLFDTFKNHPSDAGETYFQHLIFTAGMAAQMFLCGIVLLIHGLLPFLFIYTASTRMKKCHEVLLKRAAQASEKH